MNGLVVLPSLLAFGGLVYGLLRWATAGWERRWRAQTGAVSAEQRSRRLFSAQLYDEMALPDVSEIVSVRLRRRRKA